MARYHWAISKTRNSHSRLDDIFWECLQVKVEFKVMVDRVRKCLLYISVNLNRALLHDQETCVLWNLEKAFLTGFTTLGKAPRILSYHIFLRAWA